MTLEELKTEADKLGYRLVKKPERITMLPCPVCGSKNTSEWYAMEFGRYIFRKCNGCHFRGDYEKTPTKAKKKWNEAVEEFLGREKENK